MFSLGLLLSFNKNHSPHCSEVTFTFFAHNIHDGLKTISNTRCLIMAQFELKLSFSIYAVVTIHLGEKVDILHKDL